MAFENLLEGLPADLRDAAGAFQGICDEDLEKAILSKKSRTIVRAPCLNYENRSACFCVPKRSYSQQYSQLYFCRLQQLKPRIVEKARAEWGSCGTTRVLDGIKDLSETEEDSVIVGVVYKDMKLKPSALDEYMKELDVQTATQTYLSDTDRLYMEDESVRILLAISPLAVRELPVAMLVTGVVIAVLGRRNLAGEFEVKDWRFPGVLKPTSLPCLTQQSPQFVGFVSGLCIGDPSIDYSAVLRLRDFLLGALPDTGTSSEGLHLSQSVVRLILLGSTVLNPVSAGPPPLETSGQQTALRSLAEMDAFLGQLTASICVDIVPGPKDPTGFLLPQQPLHPAFFPRCRQAATFQSVTNPYMFSVNDVHFLGTSGQPVSDILDFSALEAPIEALKLTVEAQCLCPTAPDTLPCYPFVEFDPFVLPSDKPPHVIFAGGQDAVAVQYWNNGKWSASPPLDASSCAAPMALCVPKFSVLPCLVLVELHSLRVEVIELS